VWYGEIQTYEVFKAWQIFRRHTNPRSVSPGFISIHGGHKHWLWTLATTHPGYAALADPLSGCAAKRVKAILSFLQFLFSPLYARSGERGRRA